MFSSFFFCAASSSACLARYSLRDTLVGAGGSGGLGTLKTGCLSSTDSVGLSDSEVEGGAERLIRPASVLSEDAMEIMFIMASVLSPSFGFFVV